MGTSNLLAQDFSSIEKTAGVRSPSSVGDLITKIVPYLFYLAAIALLVYLVSGGLQLMMSRGDEKAVALARGKITNALLGFFIIFISFVAMRLIGQFFHISAFANIFGM